MKIHFKKNPCPYCQQLINGDMVLSKSKDIFCPFCHGKLKVSPLLFFSYLIWTIFSVFFLMYFVMRFVQDDFILFIDGVIFIISIGLSIVTLKLLFDKKSYDKC